MSSAATLRRSSRSRSNKSDLNGSNASSYYDVPSSSAPIRMSESGILNSSGLRTIQKASLMLESITGTIAASPTAIIEDEPTESTGHGSISDDGVRPFGAEESQTNSHVGGGLYVIRERRMTILETIPIIYRKSKAAVRNLGCVKQYLYHIDGIAKPFLSEDKHIAIQCFDGTLRAFGQVVFCNNPFSGALILIAMLFSHWQSGLCALYITALVNLIAAVFGVDSGLIVHGLLGYNAVLVGNGLATFLNFDPPGLLFLVATVAAPAALLAHLLTARVLANYGAAALTLPFNGVLVFTLLSATTWNSTVRAPGPWIDGSHYMAYDAIFKGISQVFILDNAHAGLVIFFGMMICSRVLALCSLIGSFLGGILAMAFFDTSLQKVNGGLVGYNCALALPAIFFFLVPRLSSFVLGLLNIILTLGVEGTLSAFFSTWSLPYMTLPFCLSTIPFLMIDSDATCVKVKPTLQVITLTDLTTPEEHFVRFADKNVCCGHSDINGDEEVGGKKGIHEETAS